MSDEKQAKKVDKLISEGDKYVSQEKFDKALKKYQKAHELDPDRDGLYEKLIEIHEKALGETDWELKDLTDHLDLVMRKQEHDYPPIKQTHAKFTPEWREANELILRILKEDDDLAAGPIIEELVAKGDVAARALIDLLRMMKKGATETEEEEPK